MGPLLPGNDLHEVEFDLDGVFVLCQSDSPADALNMGIDDDPGDSKSITQDDIGCLSSHARKGH